MNHRRSGYTLLEMVVVILVGSVITSIAIASFNGVSGRFAVRGARSTFQGLHARARAQAIEFGRTVRLNVDVSGDSVWLSMGDRTLETVRFRNELNVDIQTSSLADLRVCMNPRGFADSRCNNYSSPVTVMFLLDGDTALVEILTLGQLLVN